MRFCNWVWNMRHVNDERKVMTHNFSKKWCVPIHASLVKIGPLRRDFPGELRQMQFFTSLYYVKHIELCWSSSSNATALSESKAANIDLYALCSKCFEVETNNFRAVAHRHVKQSFVPVRKCRETWRFQYLNSNVVRYSKVQSQTGYRLPWVLL